MTEPINIIDPAIEEVYVYLWHRNAEKFGPQKFARWKPMILYKFPHLNGKPLRKVFQKMLDIGYFIPIRKNKNKHYDYLFTQKIEHRTNPELQAKIIAEATIPSPIVHFR